ncbi:MAG TPA: LLM class F420-dependent oxidoreductase [Blastocatellia bacterium]|nr:LLM class F420-dependent oxidoreductase [Blastocatellia bacterium]
MKIGLFGINYGVIDSAEAIVRVAEAAEAAGLDSVWAPEHVVLPDPRVPPSPSDPQTPIFDPLVALGYVAAHTTRMLLGTGIIILPQRNPLILAKELTSIDILSNGRLIFGLGVGYLEPEFRALGAPFEDRGPVTDESIEVLKALWTMEKPEHKGRFFSFSGIDSQPRPLQKPHPPMVIGGRSRHAALRAARCGNGWYGFFTDVEKTERIIGWIREHIANGERPAGLGDIEISVTPPLGPITKDLIKKYEDIGVHRVIPWFQGATSDDLRRSLNALSWMG